MKNFLPVILLFLLVIDLQGQHPFCGQAEVTERFFSKHPEARSAFHQSQVKTPSKKSSSKIPGIQAGPAYTIPVVFHVLHQGGAENISDAQIHDQMRILNRDFQKQNADTSIIVDPFKPLIADVGYAFKLARIDPNGQCTNGIVRHLTSRTDWDANDFSFFAYTWPRDKYLNIYVVKTMNITATAYAFLPGTPVPASADVVVTLHNMVGSIGTSTVATSRVLTHEVGHWFNLQHIWGTTNQPGVVCGDDLVDDTPETKGWVSCNTNNNGVCNPGIRENVQNYMDYSPCKIMFTLGQADRMLECINGTVNNRSNVPSLSNRIATGIEGDVYACKPTANFTASAIRTCLQTPVRFTSLENPGFSGGTRTWTFEGGSPATSSDSTPLVSYSEPGTYGVTLSVANAYGIDTLTKTAFIRVEDANDGFSAPYTMDFETDSLIAKLSVENMDENSVGWMPFSFAGAEGSSKSFLINAYDDVLEMKGEKDVFELPYLDLSGVGNPEMSFWYAYARRETSQRDSFKVQYSLNCGQNWTTISGLQTIVQMSTATGGIQTDAFTPTAAQWARQIISSSRLAPLANQNGVKFRFLFRKDINRIAANNLFLDQIRVGQEVTGVSDPIANGQMEIFPNPSYAQFTLRLGRMLKPPFRISLFDALGREVQEGKLFDLSAQNQLVINAEGKLQRGVYTFMLEESSQPTLVQKLVVM